MVRLAVILILTFSPASQHAVAQPQSAQGPLANAVARADAVFSGRFKYTMLSGFDEAKKPTLHEF